MDQPIGVLLHLVRRADRQNSALVDDGDAISHPEREVPIMRDDQRSNADPLLELQNLLGDHHGRERVQLAGRLVIENQLRLDDQRPGNGWSRCSAR